MGLLKEKITKYYIDSLISYRKLRKEVNGVYTANFNEGDKMIEVMVRRNIQSSFAYELLHFPFPIEMSNDNTFKIMKQLLRECGPELSLSKEVTDVTENRLLPLMEMYFDYLSDLARFIRAELEIIKLNKVYRGMCLTRGLFSNASSLPESVLEILLLQICTDVEFNTGKENTLPAEYEMPTSENSVLENFEDEFLVFVYKSFCFWHKTRQLAEAMAFMDLPPRFLDVLLGYRKLVAMTEKIILDEYCRTNAFILIMTDCLQTVKSSDERFALLSTVDNLRSSFLYIQGPKLSSTMDKRSYSEGIERFVSNVRRQCYEFREYFDFLCCNRKQLDNPKDIMFNALRKCSFLKNMNIRQFPDPFSVLAMVKHMIATASVYYRINRHFRFSFHRDFAIRPERFFSDCDCSVNLPLLSKEVLETLFTTNGNKRKANISVATSVESSPQLIRKNQISGSPMENKE